MRSLFRSTGKEATEALAARVRPVRRIIPDCWYEVESLSSEERAANEAMRDQYDRAGFDVSFWG